MKIMHVGMCGHITESDTAKYSTGNGGLLVTASTVTVFRALLPTSYIHIFFLSLSGNQPLSICSCFNNTSETVSAFILREIRLGLN